MKTVLAVSLLGLALSASPQTSNPDNEGFIRNWLILGPIAIEGESGATAIDASFLDGEATIKPKAGDSLAIANKVFTWKAHEASEYFVDFLKAFPERGEYVAAYAVTYVLADEDMKVTLALSTNDQGKAWLNGKQIFKFAETRVLEKDADRVDVQLTKGQNVLILKVVNEVNNWQACARFLKDGAPVTKIRVGLEPRP
jgi:hypothetical protein